MLFATALVSWPLHRWLTTVSLAICAPNCGCFPPPDRGYVRIRLIDLSRHVGQRDELCSSTADSPWVKVPGPKVLGSRVSALQTSRRQIEYVGKQPAACRVDFLCVLLEGPVSQPSHPWSTYPVYAALRSATGLGVGGLRSYCTGIATYMLYVRDASKLADGILGMKTCHLQQILF
ncbi:hypothetical protein F5X96DRAFT_478021 [Biscogniauxia mediterranea]|nr:hypothetical protein F5X96DRAFT_478021 [Biscogniauxia mediterranea]